MKAAEEAAPAESKASADAARKKAAAQRKEAAARTKAAKKAAAKKAAAEEQRAKEASAPVPTENATSPGVLAKKRNAGAPEAPPLSRHLASARSVAAVMILGSVCAYLLHRTFGSTPTSSKHVGSMAGYVREHRGIETARLP